ncbi:MAG TPA: hypothetical protein VNJ04_20560 [Gemmatimonadaceae bacterium]|nr:hypothetical protein [Gemmatimonadaceae bacterium]
MTEITQETTVRARRRKATPSAGDTPRFTLADVLAIVPKTKRSQVELLVRTGRIVPAWPAEGTGHDRAFSGQNLFEIAVAAELIKLGFVGKRLEHYFGQIILTILDKRNAIDAEYLVLLPSDDGPMPWIELLPRTKLESVLGTFTCSYVLNTRDILRNLRIALEDFNTRERK